MPGTDLFSRLADAGEEAITRLAKMPGGEQLVGAMNATRERVDELQRRVRGLEDVEKRVEALEKQVAALQGASRAPARRAASSSSARSAAARSRATTPKPPPAPTPTPTPTPGDSSAAPTGGDSPG